MTAEAWQALGSITVFIIIGGYGAWQSRRAKKLSEPTGNGFAKHVKDSLAELKQTSERIEARQVQSDSILYNHITTHANADVMRGNRSDTPPDQNTP